MPDVFTSSDKESESTSKPEVVEMGQVEAKEAKKGHFHHPFKSWIVKPHWVNFETRYKEETMELLVRRHPITNVPWILIALLMVLAPLVLPIFPILSFLPANFQTVALIMWSLVTFAYILENFLVWFFNVGIVTNVRLIDIDFFNLLAKEVSDADLKKVEDVTYKMNGAIRAVFNYGDVFVQTAGEEPNIEFLAIPHPDKVVKILQELREKGRHG